MIRLNKNGILGLAAFLLLGIAVISSCKKKTTEPDEGESFDQKAMLTHYADNLIIPSYQAVANGIGELQTAILSFEQTYSIQDLELVQQKWDALYTNWMWASAYNFGPAGEQGIQKRLVEEVATWPIDTTSMNAKVAALDTTFSDFNRDTRGLLAIEYMIYATQSTAQTVADFQADSKKIAYLKALTNKVQKQVGDVLNQWNNGYRSTFISGTGTSVGSSISLLYNEFVRGYESIKNFKLGIPLGKKAGQTGIEPDKVESRYAQKSLAFMQENITAVENNWFGKTKAGVDGIGWKEYLESVTGGQDLVNNTVAQQTNINSAMAEVSQSASLYVQISTALTPLDNLYTELQKQTRFYKSDMSSLLGIAITFTDADGD